MTENVSKNTTIKTPIWFKGKKLFLSKKLNEILEDANNFVDRNKFLIDYFIKTDIACKKFDYCVDPFSQMICNHNYG